VNGLGPSGHTIVIDEAPTPEGYGVLCIPHGPLEPGKTYMEAFINAVQHDEKYGGQEL
jgi:hypothetical protein